MRKFPMGFLWGFLATQKVSYFACGNSHREIRKHSLEARVNIGATGFPPLETLQSPGNRKLPMGFLWGFL